MAQSLVELVKDTVAVIEKVEGGTRMQRKLEDMGLRPGIKIMKKAGQPFKGPIIIQVGTAQVAIGHGMAEKIKVKV